MPTVKILEEPLTEVIALESLPPVQDSAIDNLRFFFLVILLFFHLIYSLKKEGLPNHE